MSGQTHPGLPHMGIVIFEGLIMVGFGLGRSKRAGLSR